jgi:hypothetical protein
MLWLRLGLSCRRKLLCSSPSARLPHDVYALIAKLVYIKSLYRTKATRYVITILRVNRAYSLMRQCKYPNKTDTGRNTMSLGLRLKSPTSLTTLVKPNMKTNWAQKAYRRLAGSQPSVAHQHEARSSGSTTNAKEVKVLHSNDPQCLGQPRADPHHRHG